MLASYPPFYDEDPMKTYAKIMQGNINFPSHFSKEAISIIKRLLQQKPTKRMGVTKGGADEIKQHPWFARFDWDALLQKRLRAPFVPKIKSNIDTAHFEAYAAVDQNHTVEEYQDDGSNWDAEF
jgi:serine/threonine protein kinase